jgi:hypothetical protein
MNKSIVEFFDYTLKEKTFDIAVLDKYKKSIETNYDISK